MLLGLSTIIDRPGGTIPFDFSLDLHDMEFGGSYPVQEPVRAVGEVRNTAGVFVLTGIITTRLHCVCDRCATEFEKPICYPVRAVLETDPESEASDDIWTFTVDGENADLDEIITTAFVLNMDSKMLCSEDCKGLCFRCGANLNLGPCGCKPETDSRFAVLQQLLDKS